MINVSKTFLNTNKMAKRFSIVYILVGILGLISLDKLITVFFEHNDITKQGPLTFGIV